MSKVTVVGAGNVGATCANVLAVNEVANEVVLIDIKEGFAEGKAMDIMQTAQLMGFDTVVKGVTNDYSQTANSDVVIITSGIPRKPGMTREELIGVNAGIVKSVAENCLKFSPNAILVIVANPMDPMAFLTYKTLGLPRNRVIGMGGALDSSRFKYFISQAIGCNANEVEGIVIGGHGDTTMIPLDRIATYKGMPITNFLSKEKIEEVETTPLIGIDDFMKVEIKVGQIKECKQHPKADRLLVSQIDLGSEVRQIVSGIAEHYQPEQLVGRKVLVVTNLKPVKLRGELSEGMVLAASNDGTLTLPTIIDELPNGSKVK